MKGSPLQTGVQHAHSYAFDFCRVCDLELFTLCKISVTVLIQCSLCLLSFIITIVLIIIILLVDHTHKTLL